MAASTKTTYSFDGSTQAIQKLFSSDTADIHFTFQSNDEIEKRQKLEIGAHKALLSAMSDVFAASFSGHWKDEKNIEIPDSSFEAFNAFIQYFYTNKVSISEENVGEILGLADYYQLPDLKSSCSSFMIDHAKKENVLDYLRLALKFGLKQLAPKCKQVISTNTLNVLKSPEFLQCSQDELLEILSIATFSCVEEDIFDACIEWAQARCLEQLLVTTGESIRVILGPCFDRIRFKEMDQDNCFERLEQYKEMFTRDEIIEIVARPEKNGFTIIPRYHKPLSHVFEFEKYGQQTVNKDARISLSHRLDLKAFSLPKFVSSDTYGQIDDKFKGTVLVNFFSGNSVITTTRHQFKRAKILDNDETYCFYLLTPAALSPNIFFSIELSVPQAVWPITFYVSKTQLNDVTLTPFKREWHRGQYVEHSYFITYFAALHFQQCA